MSWLSRSARNWKIWCLVLVCVALFFLRTPFLAGTGFLWMGSERILQPGPDKDAYVRIWVPPLVFADDLVKLDGTGIEAVTYATSRTETAALLDSQGIIAKARPTSELHGAVLLHARFLNRKGRLRVRIMSWHNAQFVPFLLGWIAMLFAARVAESGGKVFKIMAGAISLRFLYGFLTPWNVNSQDVDGHMHYIRLLVRRGIPPQGGECWQCYQPPPYYYLASWIYRFAHAVGVNPPDLLRLFSLFLSCGFLLLGVRTIRLAVKASAHSDAAVVLFAFWPVAIFNAPVINNDVPTGFFGAAALLCIVVWMRDKNWNMLAFALFSAAVASCFKSSGALYFGAVAIAVISVWFLEKKMDGAIAALGRRFLLLLVFAVPTALIMKSMNFLRAHQAEGQDFLVGNIGRLRAGNAMMELPRNPWNFVPSFGQIRVFLAIPDPVVSDMDYNSGFWPRYLHSSLVDYSRLGMDLAFGKAMIAVLGFLLIFLIALLLRGVSSDRKGSPFYPGVVMLFISASMIFRWMYPFACSADIRYVLGVLIPSVILVAKGLDSLSTYARLISNTVLWIFVAVSMILYAESALNSFIA